MTVHNLLFCCSYTMQKLCNISSTVYLQLYLFPKLVEQEDNAGGNKHFHPCKFSLLLQKTKEKRGTALSRLPSCAVLGNIHTPPHPPAAHIRISWGMGHSTRLQNLKWCYDQTATKKIDLFFLWISKLC